MLNRQCLKRRIPDQDNLKQEIAAWEKERNQKSNSVDCGATPVGFPDLGNAHQERRFTTEDARIKLKRLYPSIQS